MSEVDTFRPLQVPVGGTPRKVVNEGRVNLYYGGSPTVSAAAHEGVLAPGEALSLAVTTWFLSASPGGEVELSQPPLPAEDAALLGTDSTVGGPSGSPLSPLVVTSRLKTIAGAAGEVTPNISEGDAFAITATGNVTIKPPINATRQVQVVELFLIEDAAGGHTFTFSGIATIGEAPTLITTSNAVNLVQLVTRDGGATWGVIGLQAGPRGERGEVGERGATGPEGFVPSRLVLPSEFPTWKGVAETAEKRKALAESLPRGQVNGTLLLTSGTPVIVAVPVVAKQVIRGIGFAVQTAEGTPANRTHLWVALLNAAGEKVAESADYTSSASNGFANGEKKAIKFTASYEPAANEVLYAVLCEVMSSTNPITICGFKVEETVAFEEKPVLYTLGPAGLTTPASLTSPVTLEQKSALKVMPWLVLV